MHIRETLYKSIILYDLIAMMIELNNDDILVALGVFTLIFLSLILCSSPKVSLTLSPFIYSYPEENVTIINETRIIKYEIHLYVLRVLVLDEKGNPIQGALVTIYDANYTPIYSRHTDIDGYVETIVNEGQYTIVVQKEGYQTAKIQTYVSEAKEIKVTLPKSEQAKITIPIDIFIGILLGSTISLLAFYIAKIYVSENTLFNGLISIIVFTILFNTITMMLPP